MRQLAAIALALVAASCGLDASGTNDNEPLGDASRDTTVATIDSEPALDVSSPDTAPSVAEVCDFGVRAFCAKYLECAPFSLKVTWGDEATCRARMRSSCITTLGSPGIAYGSTEYLACAQKFESAKCESFFLGSVCEFPRGSLANGAPCALSVQCASRFCDVADAFCGTCQDPTPEGAPCTGSCPIGLACVGSPRKCVRVGGVSAACAPDRPCGAPLVCAAGVCAPGGTLGAPCDPSGISGTPCSPYEGFYCGGTSTCTAFAVVRGGETCGYPEPYRYCSVGATCSASSNGTCVAPAADGAACDPMTLTGCVNPSACVGGVCKQRDPAACK